VTRSARTGQLEWRLEGDWAVVTTGEADEPTADALRALFRALYDDAMRRFAIDLSESNRIPGAMLGVLAASVGTLNPVAGQLHVVRGSGTDAAALASSPRGPVLNLSPSVDLVLAESPAKQTHRTDRPA